MQVKTTKKISRSAVATVLATSSVALGLPAQTNAAVLFKDVKAADFFYSAVNELAEKKIVNGYGDGSFRPFNNVTRGEAAKMLALSLKLDVANAETTQFSDVKKGDIFYKYIAALANKGIINGYPDGSFKPNEVVQRGAMAKMVALGYEFALATNITHPFKDVEQKNIFNQHIQTLVNLNITKGTSFNTFEPAKAVTRGELATFISRANKANAGKPIYVVDNIVGNKIYINSVGYTIGSNVASYIKAENKSALIGAHVEGTFSGMTLTNVTKLTLNATGNTNSIYTFDGGNSTFNGTLVINGSYLKFKNWTLNGQTIVSETPRKSLAQYNRLSEIKIASLASGMIDFTRPTNPDDGNLNDDNGTLKPGTGTAPYAPYSEKLTPIHKYVDFTNVTVRNLFVEQNRTYIAAQKEIPTVTIRRDVEFAELNFNMRNLYLEGDESLTLYGTHDIATVYKNSYYSVYFNSDSEIDTLIVDNSNGWIDLGNYVIVDNVIIPPKTTPNDIFDDYKNDNDKIGNIEDNTGKEVDRDPIENGIVPDVTPPILELISVEPDSDYASISIQVNEPGILHYMIVPEDEPEPSVRKIVESARDKDKGAHLKKIEDKDFVSEGKYVYSFNTYELVPETKYKIYLVHVDDAGNFSGKVGRPFETKDGTPPYVDQLKAKALVGGKRIQVDFKPNEIADYYLLVMKSANEDNTLKYEDVVRDAQYSGKFTQDHVNDGFSDVLRSVGDLEIEADTNYVVYLAIKDLSGNESQFQLTESRLDSKYFAKVKTSALDLESPYVTGPTDNELQKLIPVSDLSNNREFFIYFNERLDKDSAQKIENYSLSGTGIINVPGQAPITPTRVVYDEVRDKGRVKITIPSLTGFIHNDTLRVTVSENVMDLAENKFESQFNPQTNMGPRNFAQYIHQETGDVLFNVFENRITRNESKNLAYIPYETNKAGQIYYMLVPKSNKVAMDAIHPNDFIADFNNPENSKLSGLYIEGSKKTITSELGQHELTYDYTPLKSQLLRDESYILYMVFRDRSGNLSTKQTALVITDEVAPKISSFKVAPTLGSDNSVTISLTSSEVGRVRIGYFPKYVQKDGNWVLNEKVYNSPESFKIYGGIANQSKEENLADFDANVVVKEAERINPGPNEITIDDLDSNKEYVFYVAAIDEYENFTVYKDDGSTPLIQEVYTDGIAPKIKDNIVYKNPEGNFEITFTEAILRDYANMTIDSSISPNGPTQISTLNASNWSEYLTISDGTVGFDFNKFEFVGYTEGTSIDSESVLTLRAKVPSEVEKSFTVTMNENAVDHLRADKGNKFGENYNLGRYIYRELPSEIDIANLENSILNGYYRDMTIVIDFTSTPTFGSSDYLNLYYKVVQEGFVIVRPEIKDILDDIEKESQAGLVLGSVLDIKNLNGRQPVRLSHNTGFKVNDVIYVVLEDMYGNRELIDKVITLSTP